MIKRAVEEYSDEKAERRALTTPYQPQKDVAKQANQARKRTVKGSPKSA